MNKKKRRQLVNKVPSGHYCYSTELIDGEIYREKCTFRRVSEKLYECKLINYKSSRENVDILFYDSCKICSYNDR